MPSRFPLLAPVSGEERDSVYHSSSQRRWDHPGPPHHGLLTGSRPAHLHGLDDNREGVVLAVLGQQVLADPTEGEVPVVKALEVGLSCDETLPWRDRREAVRTGRGEAPGGAKEACMSKPGRSHGAPQMFFPHTGLRTSPMGGLELRSQSSNQ